VQQEWRSLQKWSKRAAQHLPCCIAIARKNGGIHGFTTIPRYEKRVSGGEAERKQSVHSGPHRQERSGNKLAL